MNRSTTLLPALLLLTCLAPRRQAYLWSADSLELAVADSDLVVSATIESFSASNDPVPMATLLVRDTLKGKAPQHLQCILQYEDLRDVPLWQKNKTPLLVCLVNPARANITLQLPYPAPYAIRPVHYGSDGIIPLDGSAARRAPTTDFVFLTKSDDILKTAVHAIDADLRANIPHDKSAAPSVEVEVPAGSPLDKAVNNYMDATTLAFPITHDTETKAVQWITSPNINFRLTAVAILSHFKSDQNIALLKTLLTDPDTQSTRKNEIDITTYPVRDAALTALSTWNVSATNPATQPAPRTFTTMQAILQNTPPDLHPQPTEPWHKFTEGKFIDWWKKQLPGLQLNESFTLTNCTVMGGGIPFGGTEPRWSVYLILSSKSFTYFGEKHSYAISFPTFTVTESEARRWDAAKHGTLIPVTATIESITIGTNPKTYRPTQLPSYSVELHLKDLHFTLPK